MVIFFRVAAYILALAIGYVTLGPPGLRPHSNLGQNGEHALAFALLGLTFALGYPRHRLMAAILTAISCGVLELLQLFAPGRHARLEDFFVDALATLAGFAIVSFVDFAITSIRRSSPT
jgi:VanZ family protein